MKRFILRGFLSLAVVSILSFFVSTPAMANGGRGESEGDFRLVSTGDWGPCVSPEGAKCGTSRDGQKTRTLTYERKQLVCPEGYQPNDENKKHESNKDCVKKEKRCEKYSKRVMITETKTKEETVSCENEAVACTGVCTDTSANNTDKNFDSSKEVSDNNQCTYTPTPPVTPSVTPQASHKDHKVCEPVGKILGFRLHDNDRNTITVRWNKKSRAKLVDIRVFTSDNVTRALPNDIRVDDSGEFTFLLKSYPNLVKSPYYWFDIRPVGYNQTKCEGLGPWLGRSHRVDPVMVR